MLIEKEFSNVDREEERVFSVLMNEEELRLYSEFLEEREYTSVRKLKKMEQTADRYIQKIKDWRPTDSTNIVETSKNLDSLDNSLDKYKKYHTKAFLLRSRATDKYIKNQFDKVPSSTGLKKAVWPSAR